MQTPVITPAKQAAILARIQQIPIFSTLRMGDVVLTDGAAEMTVPRQTIYDGVFESFHGGILMTIADSVACFAVLTGTPDDQVMTTTDMNIRFLAPCLSDVRASARVIKFGRVMCPVAVDLFDAAGKLVAVAQVNYMLLDRLPKR
ncbi:MAG TPA: PaaI family thioesterase [Vicinamibacterales bacterium]|nr:PaaI family thioesterase [Vicinamibacterales bacterium]